MTKNEEQLAAEAVSAFTAEFKNFKANNDQAVHAVRELATANGAEVKAVMKTAEDAVNKVEAAATRLADIEQQVAGFVNSTGRAPEAKTLGDFLIQSDQYKALGLTNGQTPPSGFKLNVTANTIVGQEGSPPENADTLVPTARRAGIVEGAFRQLRVADLLVTIPIASNAWEYTREASFTNAAAETAEAAAKPESALTFELLTTNVRTIATWIKASNQILADAPALRAYIDRRLRYAIEYRLDSQLLVGNGTGQNIDGMLTAGNYTAFTPSTGDTAIDSLNKAKYELVGAEWAADGIVMNPADWGAIERLKTSEAAYLVGNPFGAITPIMWGLPIVATNAMTAGSFLMADFATSYEHLARQGTTLDVGYINDDFTRNLVTIRCERRDALATLRPASTRFGALAI